MNTDRDGVFRRGKTWVVAFDIGDQPAQRCDECGRKGLFWVERERLASCPRCGAQLRDVLSRRRHWEGGFNTKKQALARRTELVGSLHQGDYVAPSEQTVGSYLAEWLGAIRAAVRRSTWSSYENIVRLHVLPRIGSLKLQELSAARLNRVYADLLAEGRKNGKDNADRGLSPRTVRYVHTIIRKALADAVRWNRLPRNVADQADPPKPGTPDMRTWTAEELRGFLDHVRDDRLYAAWLVAATTGMRRGEVLGLRWRDLDLDASRVSILQTLVSVNYDVQFSEPKTARGRRQIALDPATVAALREHRKSQLEERLAWGPAYQDHGLVFTRENGSPVRPDRFSDMFAHHVKAAKLPPIRLHDLRHTHASMALAAGVHPKVVSERLGHSSISITLDTYSHAIPALQEEAAAKVAGLIFGA